MTKEQHKAINEARIRERYRLPKIAGDLIGSMGGGRGRMGGGSGTGRTGGQPRGGQLQPPVPLPSRKSPPATKPLRLPLPKAQPSGPPNLPGLGAEARKILQKLGATSDDVAAFASGEKAWLFNSIGDITTTSYVQFAGGKLTAGILSIKNPHGPEKPSLDTVRAMKSFLDQSTELARQLNAHTLRLEGNTVTNLGEKGVEGLLNRQGFKLDPEDPGKLIRETKLK
jgi:hypothetical protein